MRHQFSLSDVGLKLIKSYEGYRPTARTLPTGRRVAGYGHAVVKGETLELSRARAEEVLKQDLVTYEALVNDHVFAPLTQGQFDALVSLAFNIGAEAFISSEVLSSLNNGRILDAANGFDIWRKSEVSGQIYTIDALVRRRTSEKVLFLRPEKAVALAPRFELPPQSDGQLSGMSTYGPKSVPQSADYGIVSGASDLSSHRDFMPSRRREDGPAGVLTLSEVYDDSYDADTPEDAAMIEYDLDDPRLDDLNLDADLSDIKDTADNAGSPIATAAAEVNDRLQALIERPRRNAGESLPASLTEAVDADSKVVPFKGPNRRRPATDTSKTGGLAPALDKPRDRLQGEPTVEAMPTPPSQLDIMKARHQAVGAAVPLSNNDERALYDYDAQEADNNTDANSDGSTGDSAQRYIDRTNAAKPKKPRNPNTGPFSLMCILGMILMGGGAGAYMSGFDTRWGVMGELASTLAFLIGALLLLGSVYYLLKILFGRR